MTQTHTRLVPITDEMIRAVHHVIDFHNGDRLEHVTPDDIKSLQLIQNSFTASHKVEDDERCIFVTAKDAENLFELHRVACESDGVPLEVPYKVQVLMGKLIGVYGGVVDPKWRVVYEEPTDDPCGNKDGTFIGRLWNDAEFDGVDDSEFDDSFDGLGPDGLEIEDEDVISEDNPRFQMTTHLEDKDTFQRTHSLLVERGYFDLAWRLQGTISNYNQAAPETHQVVMHDEVHSQPGNAIEPYVLQSVKEAREKAEARKSREARMVTLRTDAHGKPTVWCDPEIADLVDALNTDKLSTVASCSGHGHRPATVQLSDGRHLMIFESDDDWRKAESIFPNDINGDPVDSEG